MLKQTLFLFCLVTLAASGCKSADTASTNPASPTTPVNTAPADATKTSDASVTGEQGDLPGEWDVTSVGETGSFTFDKDGTFTSSTDRDKVKTDMKGDYKLDGKTLTLTVRSMDVETSDPKQKDMVDAFKGATKELLNKPMPGTIEWKSKDEAVMTGFGGSTSLKRKS
jgi:hypothetical protein